MVDITRAESIAMQAAGGHLATSGERNAFRAGWMAGRDYACAQHAQAEADSLLMRGFRLLGCVHTRSCASVDECREVSRG